MASTNLSFKDGTRIHKHNTKILSVFQRLAPKAVEIDASSEHCSQQGRLCFTVCTGNPTDESFSKNTKRISARN
jgi:D-tyrosyl-tRNA(Tyr) deacylase